MARVNRIQCPRCALAHLVGKSLQRLNLRSDYMVNVTVTGAIVGLLIPPSHNMIIYSAASGIGVSIGDLFLAGIVPGVLTAILLMVVAWLVAVKRGYARGVFPGWPAFSRALLFAVPGLMTAIIIMGGILSGIFTATESLVTARMVSWAINPSPAQVMASIPAITACRIGPYPDMIVIVIYDVFD